MLKPNKFVTFVRNLVWPAVTAAVLAIASVAAAAAGLSSIAVPLGLAAITFAILSPRNY
ncbi:hypothetical protein [Actinomycetia phage DSL-LC01]|nr:hypothetical protein [Actinomycetia phage DSL-LC01]